MSLYSADSRNVSNLAASLDRITGAIHDMWFDVDSIEADSSAGRFTLGLSHEKFGPVVSILECNGFDAITDISSVHVGWYDVNGLTIGDENNMTIRGNIPIAITLRLRNPWILSLKEI